MAGNVTIKQSNPGWLDALLTRYREEAELAVGFPANTKAQGARYPDGTSLLLVAAVNNFGSSSRGIPARPFMHQAAEPAVRATEPVAVIMVKAINRGKATVKQALTEMGPYAQGAFQETIVSGGFAPNAPATIAAKGSATPLIDTGLMRQSLTWIVREPTK